MNKTVLLGLLLTSVITANAQDCTDESVRNEPGRFLDNHTGKRTGGALEGVSPKDIAAGVKVMTAFEAICKKDLVFTGGQAKSSFAVTALNYYNQQYAFNYTHGMGFHEFVCNRNTHKLAIVDEYQGVLRITGNPDFKAIYRFSDPMYRTNPKDWKSSYINLAYYYTFQDQREIDAINKGTGYIDVDRGGEGVNGHVLDYEKVKGAYGYYMANKNFVNVGNTGYIYRSWYLTHNDIPFFAPITRKKFLLDLIEFYDREKTYLNDQIQEKIKNSKADVARGGQYVDKAKERLAGLEQDAKDIASVNDKKKAYAQNLLTSKDEKWLGQQAAIEYEGKTFYIPFDPKKYLGDIYGQFYFKEFYTGDKGLNLYQINPEYLKKYPPKADKPSVIEITYRFVPVNKFTISVRDTYINKLDIEAFRKLLN